MAPALHLVPVEPATTGLWKIGPDDRSLDLLIDGAAVCAIYPYTDDKTGALAWWGAERLGSGIEEDLGLDDNLTALCAKVAAIFGVAAPVPPGILARLGLPPQPVADAPAQAEAGLLERFADCLACILDEPLQTLAGGGPDGGAPLELRLSHFRPDLSETAAVLLEEVGR